jgi:serine/threonine protein kinase/Tol biopolymer transport system component
MPLSDGARLGPYEILAPIGAGGMGEVYRARDSRLGRTVAIKILSEHLSIQPQFRERFEREARAVSSLNHPHICTLHDLGCEGGVDYVVMEYLEGETLAQRLKKGALPPDRVLEYAIQVTDAIDTAHRHGVIHRDLKPGNIVLTKKGAKLLDFGLAKMRVPGADGNRSALPTHTTPLTDEGAVIGTLQYMAPEQLEGKEADARTDLFALGAVIYEMATGRKAFDGASQASLISAIMTSEPPPISILQSTSPPALDHAVRTCLAKDPDMRWSSAHDVLVELKWIAAAGSRAGEAPQVLPLSRRNLPLVVAAVSGFAIAVAAIGLAFSHFSPATSDSPAFRFSVMAPKKGVFKPGMAPAVSPDGRHLAFIANTGDFGKGELWIRDFDSLGFREVPGTTEAADPFWSPDSRFIGFFHSNSLKKIPLSGGPILSLCETDSEHGESWSPNGVILFAKIPGALFRVSDNGGRATPVTELDKASGETNHCCPWFLPDGHHFLYTALNQDPTKNAVYVGDLDSKTRRLILTAKTVATAYAKPGYLLFTRDEGTLMAQAFDARKDETTGDPVPIAEKVDSASFSASQNGVLAYHPSDIRSEVQLTWFDPHGREVGAIGKPGIWGRPSISPDGNSVVFDGVDPATGSTNLYLYDVAGNTTSRLTSSDGSAPVWSPDGSHIAFSSYRDGQTGLYQKATGRAGLEEVLDRETDRQIDPVWFLGRYPSDWSLDGRYIVEVRENPKTKTDIWVLPVFGDRMPFAFVDDVFWEGFAKLSPNGRWLAYPSDPTKRFEIYVQPFPAPGGQRWQVSTNGGDFPAWSRDGRRLFFVDGNRTMMASEVKTDGVNFQFSAPKPLFETRLVEPSWFDVSKDGRFLIPNESSVVPITVVLNWPAVLRK